MTKSKKRIVSNVSYVLNINISNGSYSSNLQYIELIISCGYFFVSGIVNQIHLTVLILSTTLSKLFVKMKKVHSDMIRMNIIVLIYIYIHQKYLTLHVVTLEVIQIILKKKGKFIR